MTPTYPRLAALAVAALLGGSTVALADGEHDTSHHADAAAAKDYVGDPYPLSTDVLTGEPLGDAPVTVVHEGRQLRFASAENAAAFKADPAKPLAAVDAKIVADQMPLYPMTTCPVSGEALGSMGKPIDRIVGNRLVRLCCGGCVKKLDADPAKSLAKLDAAAIEAQAASYPLDVCVVSKESLAEMGEPQKAVVAGRLVMTCCAGCQDAVNENPAKVIAQIDAARTAAAATRPAAMN